MKFLDDHPALQDHLGFSRIVSAIETIILQNKLTSLTFAILGRWGMGKTTLMKLLEKQLQGNKVVTIWFDAWKYSQDEELWAAFLQSIVNQIHDRVLPPIRWLYQFVLLVQRLKWRRMGGLLAAYLVKIILVSIPVVLAVIFSRSLSQSIDAWLVNTLGALATAALGIWAVVKPVIKAIHNNVTIDFQAFFKSSNYEEKISFLDHFHEHFTDIAASLYQVTGKPLVVFIDDLDRCPPDRIVQVLDAIKIFIDVPHCFYILGIDEEVIKRAVAFKFPYEPLAQKEYLGKMIQFSYRMPPLGESKVFEFLDYIGEALPDPRCKQVLAKGIHSNPRELIRAVNLFLFNWHLFASTLIHPVRLAKLIVLQQRFPDLYQFIYDHTTDAPETLCELERFFSWKNNYPLPGYLSVPFYLLARHSNSVDLQVEGMQHGLSLGSNEALNPENAAYRLLQAVHEKNTVNGLVEWAGKNNPDPRWERYSHAVQDLRTESASNLDILLKPALATPSDELALAPVFGLFTEDPQASFVPLSPDEIKHMLTQFTVPIQEAASASGPEAANDAQVQQPPVVPLGVQ